MLPLCDQGHMRIWVVVQSSFPNLKEKKKIHSGFKIWESNETSTAQNQIPVAHCQDWLLSNKQLQLMNQ